MSAEDIIRAWKDPVYQESLSDTQRELLPANPAGEVVLSDEDINDAAGGYSTVTHFSCSPNPVCCSPVPNCY